jgi:hypothetical protein
MPSPKPYVVAVAVAVAAVAVTAGLTACGEPDVQEPQQQSSPSSEITPAGVGFPDMSGFAEGDHSLYFSGGQRYHGFAFRTEDGQKCVSNSYRSPQDTLLRCWGPRADKGSGTWEMATRSGAVTTIRRLPDTATTTPGPDPTPILPARHVLSVPEAQLVCGVDDRGSTACKVGDHGFVLTPNSTELF